LRTVGRIIVRWTAIGRRPRAVARRTAGAAIAAIAAIVSRITRSAGIAVTQHLRAARSDAVGIAEFLRRPGAWLFRIARRVGSRTRSQPNDMGVFIPERTDVQAAFSAAVRPDVSGGRRDHSQQRRAFVVGSVDVDCCQGCAVDVIDRVLQRFFAEALTQQRSHELGRSILGGNVRARLHRPSEQECRAGASPSHHQVCCNERDYLLLHIPLRNFNFLRKTSLISN
jgi:hypothetical protein